MKRLRKTFKTIVEQTADSNRLTLMEKARVANRLAKSLSGRKKMYSYEIKIKAMLALISKFSEKIELRIDWQMPEMVLMRTRGGGALHLPKSRLPLAIRQSEKRFD